MKLSLAAAGMAAGMLLASTQAGAGVILTATLTIAEEPHVVTPTTTGGAPRAVPSGEALFELDDSDPLAPFLIMQVTVFNIDVNGTQTADTNDDLRAAHIHAPINAITRTGPVVWGFFGTPDNDNDPDNLVLIPFTSGVGGTFSSIWNASEGNSGTTLIAQIPNLLAERAYINFHTIQHPAGEIRGTLQVVPEPGSLLLAALGGLAMTVAIRRRQPRKPSP